MTNKTYVALDSGNGLVDSGKRLTVKGWRRRAERRMPVDLRRVGFEAFAHVCPTWLTGRGFEYVRMAYGKR